MSSQTKPGRGGYRKGSGRKATGKNTVRLTFSIPVSTAEALSELAKNKSRFVAEAILKAITKK